MASWQDHFRFVVLSEETQTAGCTIRAHDKRPTMFSLEEAHGVLELHVNDGHGAGDPKVARKFLECVSSKLEVKWVDDLEAVSSYE